MAKTLLAWIDRRGKMDDLGEAIRKAQRAVDTMPGDHPDLAAWLSTLANRLLDQYKRTGKMEDLEEAIQMARRAVDITPADHADLAALLANLAVMLSDQYKQKKKMEYLEEAIQMARRAVDITPVDHPDLAGRLNNLAIMLSDRDKRKEKMEDLEEAIQMAWRAVDITPVDHPDLAGRLNNLAIMLSDRYKRAGKMDDLEEAIQIARRAMDITPADHADLAGRLINLANRLSDRYKRTGKMDDLEEAIQMARRAVDITPADHADLATLLNNLAIMFSHRYKRTWKMEGLEEAIQMARRAVDITPVDHPDLAAWLNTLANSLSDRYKQTGKMEDLEEAIQKAQRAVDTMPANHPDLATWLNNLAKRLLDRYIQLHEQTDRDASTASFLKAYNIQNARPLTRVQAARGAIDLLVEDKSFPEAASLSANALRLLPLVCGRALTQEDQQHAITQTAGLAAEACSLLLKATDNPRLAGDPNTIANCANAVEHLEQGRGLIIGYLIDGRSDLSELAEKYPKEAEDLDQLRYRASAPISKDSSPEIQRHLSRERDEAVKSFEKYLGYIRTHLPGFDRFLLSPSFENMKRHAADGPIVIVNVTSISSDALIVLTSGVVHVPLPDFPASQVGQYSAMGLTRDLSRLMEKEGRVIQDQQTTFPQFLRRLWSDCVRPVLDKLDLLQPTGKTPLPRIWWIGTGLASSLPFHAAGDHSEGTTENTFSCAISSYTLSIKALRYAREQAAMKPSTQSLLLVTMPETPGADRLPGADAEAKAIQETICAPHVVQPLPQPSADQVLQVLKDHSIAHFACHGSSNMVDPSSSYLALRGDSDCIPDQLTVQKVSESHLGQVWLAYLSACSTAANQASDLADEALHLASGFQVAGFGHTVASMWPANDDICVLVASTFYRELLTNERIHEGNRGVAVALHTAVAKVRAQNLEQPHLWAQYIHLGA